MIARKEKAVRYLGKRKGAVLIVVLGILVVLALLATAFATLQATERQVARNYMDMVRAKLLAQSGLEDAIQRVRDLFPFRFLDATTVQPWKYWGLDKTETDEASLTARPTPIERSVNPSFAYEDEAVQNPFDTVFQPRTLIVEGREVGFSGRPEAGVYGPFTEHYVLKVMDLSGSLYVNDGLDHGPNGTVSQNLKRILNILGEQASVNIKGLGDKILMNRPTNGYRHIRELLPVVSFDEAAFQRLKPHVTVDAWVDKNIPLPVPLSQKVYDLMKAKNTELGGIVELYRGQKGAEVFRFARAVDAAGKFNTMSSTGLLPINFDTIPPQPNNDPSRDPAVDARLYGIDVLNAQYIEVVSRAPVNVNSATREVLISLFSGLKGHFMGDRRRNNPRYSGDLYLSFKLANDYRPTFPSEGDEYGYLRETKEILKPTTGSRVAGEIYADQVADELIACRTKKASPYNPAFSYANKPWAGVMKSWEQFNMFVDHLVYIDKSVSPTFNTQDGHTVGLLKDDRDAIVKDYDSEGVDATGSGRLITSEFARWHSSKAMADVIKSNFNPNLHLNELNPDENMHYIVDKTDLHVFSTEFNFLPTGYVEIECLGRVVQPPTVGQSAINARAGRGNKLVAQAKIAAVYKFYDLYRETTQRHFQPNGLTTGPQLYARSATQYDTNNGMTLEVGPEPDNGDLWADDPILASPTNEWGGYLALPTVGGICHDAFSKAPRSLVSTPSGGAQMTPAEALHVHFQLDHDAHYHLFGAAGRPELGSNVLLDDEIFNWPDPGVTYSGPYAPTHGAVVGNRPFHRLAKSFRRTASSGTVSEPVLTPYPPSDLRLDGIYSERHATPAYYTSMSTQRLWEFSAGKTYGLISFWLKPSFYPEFTGKVRNLWDLSRYHQPCGAGVHNFPFVLWFFPAHYNPSISEKYDPTPNPADRGTRSDGSDHLYRPDYWHNNMGHFKPMSLVYGAKAWHNKPTGVPTHEFGKCSFPLNHHGHADNATKPSLLRAHKWLNVSFFWDADGGTDQYRVDGLYINGSTTLTQVTYKMMTEGWGHRCDVIWGHEQHDIFDHSVRDKKQGVYNHMRLGAPSQIAGSARVASGGYRGNNASDCTFDEFFVWNGSAARDIESRRSLWERGRYFNYKAGGGTGVGSEPSFTSQEFELKAAIVAARTPAPPSGKSASTMAPEVPQVRVLGLQWTWFGEYIEDRVTPWATWDGKPVLYDYDGTADGSPARDVKPQVILQLIDGTWKSDELKDSHFSPVRLTTGENPVISDPTKVRYEARFRLLEATAGSILCSTPVLDDVTVYFDDGRNPLISYVYDNRSLQ